MKPSWTWHGLSPLCENLNPVTHWVAEDMILLLLRDGGSWYCFWYCSCCVFLSAASTFINENLWSHLIRKLYDLHFPRDIAENASMGKDTRSALSSGLVLMHSSGGTRRDIRIGKLRKSKNRNNYDTRREKEVFRSSWLSLYKLHLHNKRHM